MFEFEENIEYFLCMSERKAYLICLSEWEKSEKYLWCMYKWEENAEYFLCITNEKNVGHIYYVCLYDR